MAVLGKPNKQCLFTFTIVLLLCLVLECFILRSISSIDCKYLPTSSNLLIESTNVTKLNKKHENEMSKYKLLITNYTKQLKQLENTLNNKTETILNYEAMSNPLSFEQWIKGIGDTKLSNIGFSETCVVPNIFGFELSQSAVQHKDPFYDKIHRCNDHKKWSDLLEISKYERYIMINRDKFKCMNIFQYQSKSILRGNLEKINADNLWTEINDNSDYIMNASLIKLKIKNLTQTIWLACNASSPFGLIFYNHYVSVLPLKIRAPKIYQQQLEKYESHKFKRHVMPNVIIFVVDSTSRSNFHRGSTSTDNYLQNVQKSEGISYELFEFFRHSTVGWGTGINLMAMVQGGNGMESQLDLFEYYHKLGYIIPAMEEYLPVIHSDSDTKNDSNIYTSQQWDQTMEYTFYLTHNVFGFNCKYIQYWSTQAWVHFVTDTVNNVHNNYDKPLPYFMVVHMEDNHRADGWFSYVIDRYYRQLVEYFDFSNTVFHIIGDHGALVGTSTSTQLGRWEVTNPVSILFIPRNLLSKYQMEILRINQQRLVTHYDFHVFFKQIPLLFTDHYDSNNAEEIDWLKESLPINTHKKRMYKNIIREIISVNRSCNEIDAPKGFCFCDIPQNKEITAELILNDKPLIEFVIETINNMTGNGKYDCCLLNANEFTVVTHLQHHNNNDIQLVIQQVMDPNTFNIYKLKKENKILTYFVYIEVNQANEWNGYKIPNLERDGMMVPLIDRLDYFKFEHCLTREYDIESFKQNGSEFTEQFKNTNNDLPPVVFTNMEYTKSLLREQRQINLRLCKCKTSDKE